MPPRLPRRHRLLLLHQPRLRLLRLPLLHQPRLRLLRLPHLPLQPRLLPLHRLLPHRPLAAMPRFTQALLFVSWPVNSVSSWVQLLPPARTVAS
ncbi:hypothetical protein D3C81_1916050 [compost metagenome]